MPLWKNANSPSSSSSSASSSPKFSAFSPRGNFGRSSHRSKDIDLLPWRRRDPQPRLTRQRKLRHLTDLEVSELESVSASGGNPPSLTNSTPVSRSSSNLQCCAPSRSASSPVLLPQPLPLPEFTASAAGITSPQLESVLSGPGLGLGLSTPGSLGLGCPLPSPREASRNEGNGASVESPTLVEPIGERLSSAFVIKSRLSNQHAHRNPEHSDISLNGTTVSHRRKEFKDPNSTGSANFRLNIPAKSAPSSGFSSPVPSPVRSPRRLSNVDFSTSTVASPGLLVWSAPEVPSTDITSIISPRTSPEKIMGSSDQSSVYSPTKKSPTLRSRNPSAPPSPLHIKMFSGNSTAWNENGASINVHPLPLPPGVAYQNATKTELLPMMNQWQKGKCIGSGTFGNVYEGTNRHTGALCAMKEVNIIPDDAKSAECLKQLEQEIKFLSQFKHPNIVQYYGSEIIEDRFYIFLEYVHPGSINKYVQQHCGAMTESVVRNFTRHILKGLAYLHSKDIVHRDIKGANLLVDVNGVVKLADFGMAKHLSGAASALSLKGSPYWMAPEVMKATMNKDIGYDLAVDIWSLGCTIIEMYTGKHPWSGLEGAAAMFKVLYKDPPIPETLSAEGKDFLRCCFLRNPADRPTANTLLEHLFIRRSKHYKIHGSLQAFAGIKIFDNSISPREVKATSDSCVKGKHSPNSCLNSENCHSHVETSESASSSVLPRLTPDIVPSLSPPHPNLIVPGGSLANVVNGVQLDAGNFPTICNSRAYRKEAVKLC